MAAVASLEIDRSTLPLVVHSDEVTCTFARRRLEPTRLVVAFLLLRRALALVVVVVVVVVVATGVVLLALTCLTRFLQRVRAVANVRKRRSFFVVVFVVVSFLAFFGRFFRFSCLLLILSLTIVEQAGKYAAAGVSGGLLATG